MSLTCLANTLTAGLILKDDKKSPLLWGRDILGGISGDNLGEGNCESKIASRQWGDNFLPRDINLSRRALWAGAKSPKSGKEDVGALKPPLPTTPEKGAASEKIPISMQSTTRKVGIFDSSALFWGGGKWGF